MCAHGSSVGRAPAPSVAREQRKPTALRFRAEPRPSAHSARTASAIESSRTPAVSRSQAAQVDACCLLAQGDGGASGTSCNLVAFVVDGGPGSHAVRKSPPGPNTQSGADGSRLRSACGRPTRPATGSSAADAVHHAHTFAKETVLIPESRPRRIRPSPRAAIWPLGLFVARSVTE